MNWLLFGIYCFVLIYHVLKVYTARTNWFTVICTLAFLWLVMSGFDYMNQHDLRNYYIQYVYRDMVQSENFWLYYGYFLLESIGKTVGMSFDVWWRVCNALYSIVILYALKKNDYNPHNFLVYYMGLFFMLWYAGLKALYGFAFVLLGSGFLLRGGWRNKTLYALCILVAASFQPMYYFYLAYALVYSEDIGYISYIKKHKYRFIVGISALSICFCIVLSVSGSANIALTRIMSSFIESEKVGQYFELSTRFGFFIPVVMQILLMECSRVYRRIAQSYSVERQGSATVLYYVNVMKIMYYPLFLLSTVFMRFISMFALVTLSAVGQNQRELVIKDRKRLMLVSMVLIAAYYYYNFVIGNSWKSCVVPLFSFVGL